MKAIVVESPAKINLCLYILGRRDDGYHEIVSVMQTVDLMDMLELENSDKFALDVRGMALDGENSIETAWRVLCAFIGKEIGVSVRLFKCVPLGAGLGGGSSNAAAFLIGMNKLFGLGLHLSELTELAAQVGSDVPFFLSGGSAIVRGRGEIVQPIVLPTEYNVLLIVPPFSVSTSHAYSKVRNYLTSEGKIGNLISLMPDEFWHIIGDLNNDFLAILRDEYPQYDEHISRLKYLGAEYATLSGSGSAYFGIFRDGAKAVNAALQNWDGMVFLLRPISGYAQA